MLQGAVSNRGRMGHREGVQSGQLVLELPEQVVQELVLPPTPPELVLRRNQQPWGKSRDL